MKRPRPFLLLAAAGLLLFHPLRAAPAEKLDPALMVSEASLAKWNDWRFGLFIHWGPWSQTKVGYIWKMTSEDSPAERQQRFELYRTFNPVRFDPRKWARAAREAGMKYVVFVTKHHDGMNNWDTALSDFKVTAPESPNSRLPHADLTRTVVDAFRAEGLAIGLYYSHIDWHHPDGKYFSREHWDYDPGRIDSDPASWERFVAYEKGQLRELLTNYGKIDILWFDIYWPFADIGSEPISHPVVRRDMLDVLAMIKRLQPDIIFNDRGTDLYGGFYTPEQRVPETGLPGNWETSITITNGRGYWCKGDQVDAKSPAELIHLLVDTASKGGNFLMNVGPRPDGEWSEGEYAALAGVGRWMKVNGESIYGTQRSLFLDLPWGFSTTRGSTVYLQVFDWPATGELLLPGLRSPVRRAWLLADPDRKPLAVSRAGDDTVIAVGPESPDPVAGVVALELAGRPAIVNRVRQEANDPIVLGAARARIESATAHYNYGRATRHGNFIEGIRSVQDRISWEFEVKAPGDYELAVQYAVDEGDEGGAFAVNLDGGEVRRATTVATADWEGPILEVKRQVYVDGAAERHDNRWVFGTISLGRVTLDPAGPHRLEVRPTRLGPADLMLLKSVVLTPVADAR